MNTNSNDCTDLESTTLTVNGNPLTITRHDLAAIRNAFLEYIKTWDGHPPDRQRVLREIEASGAFITEDGVCHVGMWMLISDGAQLFLDYTPRPQGDSKVSFGSAAEVEKTKDGWRITSFARTHHRWK